MVHGSDKKQMRSVVPGADRNHVTNSSMVNTHDKKHDKLSNLRKFHYGLVSITMSYYLVSPTQI